MGVCTPYAVSYGSGTTTFILVTMHVIYGDRLAERTGELRAIAEWLARWARSANAFHHNLVLLGDFNIDRKGDPRYDAFTSTGLHVPEELHSVPRTVSDACTPRADEPAVRMSGGQAQGADDRTSDPSSSVGAGLCARPPAGPTKFYDQIAWFPSTSTSGNSAKRSPTARSATAKQGLSLDGFTERDLSWKISDHLPLWVEFEL